MTWRYTLALTCGVLAFMAGSDARADEGDKVDDSPAASSDANLGYDEVTLKNGGTVRGTIISHEPGNQVVIKVYGQDKPRTIGWPEVADIEKNKYAPVPATAKPAPSGDDDDDDDNDRGAARSRPAEASGDATQLDPTEPGIVQLHINTDDPDTTLFEHIGGGAVAAGNSIVVFTASRALCRAPCNMVVDNRSGRQLYIGGSGVTSSSVFSFAGRTGSVTLDVDTGDSAGYGAGFYMLWTGAALTLAGGLMLGLSAGIESFSSPVVTGIGAGGLGLGLVMLGIGIPLIVTNGTDVNITDADGTTTAAATSRRALAKHWSPAQPLSVAW